MARAKSKSLKTRIPDQGTDDPITHALRYQNTRRRTRNTGRQGTEARVLSLQSYARSSSRKKHKRGITIPFALAMTIFLVMITSASIAGFEWLRGGFLNSGIFTLRGISVHGNRRISSKDIMDTCNLRVGTDSIYSIMPHILEKRIKKQFRYVKRVSLQRRVIREGGTDIYGWITIEIEEREPFALVDPGGDDDSLIMIDNQGSILEEVREESSSPYKGMPVIVSETRGSVSIHGSENNVQNRSDEADILACPASDLALDVLVSAHSVIPELFDDISCIDARDPDSIILRLQEIAEGGAKREVKIRIASDRIKEGLSDILPVIMKLREEKRGASYIDARFPGAVYCGMGNSPHTPEEET